MDPAAERKMQFLFSLRSHGVTNKRVLTAMEKVDRGKYIRGTFEDRAYEDTPLPIACGQTISQPSIVALMTEALWRCNRATRFWRSAPDRVIRPQF